MNIKYLGVLLILFLTACQSYTGEKSPELLNKINSESKKNRRYDDFLLGLKLGQTQKEFYEICWQLNKDQRITNGSKNTSVKYVVSDKMGNKIEINFFPAIQKGRIYKFDVVLSYVAWAPWNKKLWAEYLLEQLPAILDQWYGKGDYIREQKLGKSLIYRVDGNRLNTLSIADERYVSLIVRDLSTTIQ